MIREIEKQRMFCFLLLRFGPESLVHEYMETVDNDAFTGTLFQKPKCFVHRQLDSDTLSLFFLRTKVPFWTFVQIPQST